MTEKNYSLPANGITVNVQSGSVRSSVTEGSSALRLRKGTTFVILRGIAPLIIVAVIAILLLNGGILVLVGLGIIAGIIALAVQYRKSVSRRIYSTSQDDWMSRTGFYLGPFDDTGLPGGAVFEKQHSYSGNPPQVRLLVTDDGLEFGPAGHSGTLMKMPFKDLLSILLIEGTNPRKLVVTPPIADQVGQIVVTTTQGHIARFSGIPIETLRATLADRGATIETKD